METNRTLLRWGAGCALVSGIILLVPLLFYFYFLPAAGSSATHAQNPTLFLPWMVGHGEKRIALWWTICLPFLIALFGIPSALRRKLKFHSPSVAQISELAGILGFFTIVIACLILAAGELPLAKAYVAAGEKAQSAIVATYEWQRLVTALFFDVLGFFLLGVWILANSTAGLRSCALPRGIGWFGIVTALSMLSCAAGYLTNTWWLGELGIGQLAFFALPAWMIWLGAVLWRSARITGKAYWDNRQLLKDHTIWNMPQYR